MKLPHNYCAKCALCRSYAERQLKAEPQQCEGTSTKAHPHAFGSRVECRCPNRAKTVVQSSHGAMNVCGRCAKKPIKWRGA